MVLILQKALRIIIHIKFGMCVCVYACMLIQAHTHMFVHMCIQMSMFPYPFALPAIFEISQEI